MRAWANLRSSRQLLAGPRQGEPPGLPPVTEHRLDEKIYASTLQLVLLVLDATQAEHPHERSLWTSWRRTGRR